MYGGGFDISTDGNDYQLTGNIKFHYLLIDTF
jgi:hypothetical protein